MGAETRKETMTIKEISDWTDGLKDKAVSDPCFVKVPQENLARILVKQFGDVMVGELVFMELRDCFCEPGEVGLPFGSLLN